MEIKNVFPGNENELEDMGGGLRRKVCAYNDDLMAVEVHFDTGTVAAVHHHPHTQVTYVVSGKFEFELDGKKVIVGPGDSLYKQGNLPHGATCLEAGMLIDMFTPHREDFV